MQGKGDEMGKERRIFGGLVIVAAMLLFVGCDQRQESVKGGSAADFAEMMAQARNGDALSAYNVAVRYLTGDGVACNEREGFEWMSRAAYAGEPNAQFNLGVMYASGDRVPQSVTNAAKWFLQAAEAGNARAQYYAGDCCYVGFGVSKDREAAISWYRKSAAQGVEEAKGRLKEIGVGT